jgi:hypothetical protein
VTPAACHTVGGLPTHCEVRGGTVIVPAPIVTEVAHFLQIDPAPAVEAAFLHPFGP